MREFLLRVRHHTASRALRWYLRPKRPAGMSRLGSSYGGWWILDEAAAPGKVAYCAGAGEDITFDMALHELGMSVRVFDPTPRAVAHVGKVAPVGSSRFTFLPVGWWSEEAQLKFFAPMNPAHVSHSVVNLQNTTSYFTAEVMPVWKLSEQLGDGEISILKMDIEGAEYAVLDSLCKHGPLPEVLCVEFDQPEPLRKVLQAVKQLLRAGYRLAVIDGWNYTFLRGAPGTRA